MAKLGDMVEYLKRNGVAYEVVEHTEGSTVRKQETSSGNAVNDLARTFIVQADDKRCMVVLPASSQPNELVLSKILKANNLHLAQQDDLQPIFPECEFDAMPPFGNLYALPVIIDKELAKEKEIIFNACSKNKSIRLKMDDYLRIVKPQIKEIL